MNKKTSYLSSRKISIMRLLCRDKSNKDKSIRTQYKVSHFGGDSHLKQNVVVKLPIPLSRKTIVATKDFSGNTDVFSHRKTMLTTDIRGDYT